MTGSPMLSFAPMIGLLAWAAVSDLRSRRIPNWLTLGLAAAGLIQSFAAAHTVGPISSILGFFAGFGLMLPLFVISAVGGGDVKLLAAVGCWMGPFGAVEIFAATAVSGMFIVLGQALWQGRTKTLLRNSAMIAINVAHVRQVGVDHVAATGLSCGTVDQRLPYAVPILIATLLVLATTWKGF